MIIGSKIRTLRTVKGFSQENMAEMLGMSLNAYAKIEREETNVQINRLDGMIYPFYFTTIVNFYHSFLLELLQSQSDKFSFIKRKQKHDVFDSQ